MAITLGYEGLVPYYYFDGSTIYIPPDASAGVVQGNEGYMDSSQRGLTVGCWIKASVLAASTTYALISKMGGSGEYGYELDFYDAKPRMFTSSDGTTGTGSWDMAAGSASLSTDTWYFLVGRWNSSSTDIFVNAVNAGTAASATSAIYNTPTYFVFGGRGNGTNKFTGYMAYPFICASSLPDAWISKIYQAQAPLFT